MMGVNGIPRVVFGMVYAVVAFGILAYLFRRGMFSRKIGYLFLGLSTAMGFLVFAPMLPNQFQLLVLGELGRLRAPLPVAALGFALFIVLTFVFGRIFCGYLCPIGAVQELAYRLPTKKLRISRKAVPMAFHLAFFAAFIVLGVVFSVEVLAYFGFRQFFHLNVTSVFFYVFLGLLALSVFVYRPFCRLFCPYGVLLSLVSIKGLFKLRRNDDCIDCKLCGDNCPTNEAGRYDLRQECYMCNRCRDICPVDGLDYSRR